MNVDPERLRELAASMDAVGSEVDALDVRAMTDAVGSAMGGSPIVEVCATAGEYMEGAALRMTMRCNRIANICRGTAGTYQVADDEFRDSLDSMGGGL